MEDISGSIFSMLEERNTIESYPGASGLVHKSLTRKTDRTMLSVVLKSLVQYRFEMLEHTVFKFLIYKTPYPFTLALVKWVKRCMC